MSLIKEDLSRLGKPTMANAFKWYFIPRGECFQYNVWLRALQAVRRHKVMKVLLGLPVYAIYRHYEFKYGIHGNANIEIGGGLRVVHGPCNLNAAKIGRNFTVYSGVTIGVKNGGVPTIGDNVSIYPNSVVCGKILINEGATIGALSYIDKDVAVGAKVHR